MFDWIEVQADCIKDVMLLFPEFDLTLNKVDGITKRLYSLRYRKGCFKTCKRGYRKAYMFGFLSLLRDYLNKSAENVKNLRTFMVQCIGNVFIVIY